MSVFWTCYAIVGVLTAIRAWYGMWKVKSWVAADVREDAMGVVYVAMLVSSVAMGVCWWIYWPALGAASLVKFDQEFDHDEEDDDGDV